MFFISVLLNTVKHRYYNFSDPQFCSAISLKAFHMVLSPRLMFTLVHVSNSRSDWLKVLFNLCINHVVVLHKDLSHLFTNITNTGTLTSLHVACVIWWSFWKHLWTPTGSVFKSVYMTNVFTLEFVLAIYIYIYGVYISLV